MLEIVDLRNVDNPLKKLKAIQSEHDIQIWAEGDSKIKLEGVNRYELVKEKPLVVWTTPPGPFEWRDALEQVKPIKIFIFASDPKVDDPQIFLDELVGLVKYALRVKDGEILLDALAAATCQRENTIRMGLLWLVAKGLVDVRQQNETTVWLANGTVRKALE